MADNDLFELADNDLFELAYKQGEINHRRSSLHVFTPARTRTIIKLFFAAIFDVIIGLLIRSSLDLFTPTRTGTSRRHWAICAVIAGPVTRIFYAAIRNIILTLVKSMRILLEVLLPVIFGVVLYALAYLTPLSPSEWGQLFSPWARMEYSSNNNHHHQADWSGGPGETRAKESSLFSQFAEMIFSMIITMVLYDSIRDITRRYAIPSTRKKGGGFCFVSKSTRARTPAASINDSHIWYYDTCSTYSMTGDPSLLLGMHPAQHVTSSSATGHQMSSYQCGRVSGAVNLSGVRYFPGAPNLISNGHLLELGCAATIDPHEGFTVRKNGIAIGRGRVLENNMTTIDFLGDSSLGSICHGCPCKS